MTTMLYRKNLYAWEQMARLASGAGVALYGVFGGLGPLMSIALIAGGAGFALTGVFGWCPACAAFGRNIGKRG
jgi:Protein of unknown function (DUF2892)